VFPLSAKKVIARRCAQELKDGAIINLGIGAPEFIAAVAAEEGISDRMTLTAESGVIGGVPCGGKDFGAAQNATARIEQESQFDFYDGGGLDVTYLGFAQADRGGNVNISRFGSKIYGCGGSMNIAQNTHKLIFCGTFTAGGLRERFQDGKLVIEQEGRNQKFLRQVDQITYSAAAGLKRQQEVWFVTERAVFQVTKHGLTLKEIAPGIEIERDILAQMEFRPEIAKDLKEMDGRLFCEPVIGLGKTGKSEPLGMEGF
jgi:propionate CoA-transferase